MTGPIDVSFEFFPPADDAGERRLWETIEKLGPLEPAFYSVTYGAGGSTQERTNRVVRRINRETPHTAAAHLTCVGSTREQIDDLARAWWDEGIRSLVALRGDPPKSVGTYRPTPGGYANAAELVAGLRQVADFDISVACYPEVHPDSPSEQADLDNLKRKFDNGANRAITQFFFEPEMFLRFRDKAVKHGITQPLIPGILPVFNVAKVQSFAEECGATIPAWLKQAFEGLDDDPEARKLVAAQVAGELATKLHAEGVNQFHFYTLNRPDLTYAVCRRLGIQPVQMRKAA
jgi:methylenetetrahydrofolate reductase (NADPH)